MATVTELDIRIGYLPMKGRFHALPYAFYESNPVFSWEVPAGVRQHSYVFEMRTAYPVHYHGDTEDAPKKCAYYSSGLVYSSTPQHKLTLSMNSMVVDGVPTTVATWLGLCEVRLRIYDANGNEYTTHGISDDGEVYDFEVDESGNPFPQYRKWGAQDDRYYFVYDSSIDSYLREPGDGGASYLIRSMESVSGLPLTYEIEFSDSPLFDGMSEADVFSKDGIVIPDRTVSIGMSFSSEEGEVYGWDPVKSRFVLAPGTWYYVRYRSYDGNDYSDWTTVDAVLLVFNSIPKLAQRTSEFELSIGYDPDHAEPEEAERQRNAFVFHSTKALAIEFPSERTRGEILVHFRIEDNDEDHVGAEICFSMPTTAEEAAALHSLAHNQQSAFDYWSVLESNPSPLIRIRTSEPLVCLPVGETITATWYSIETVGAKAKENVYLYFNAFDGVTDDFNRNTTVLGPFGIDNKELDTGGAVSPVPFWCKGGSKYVFAYPYLPDAMQRTILPKNHESESSSSASGGGRGYFEDGAYGKCPWHGFWLNFENGGYSYSQFGYEAGTGTSPHIYGFERITQNNDFHINKYAKYTEFHDGDRVVSGIDNPDSEYHYMYSSSVEIDVGGGFVSFCPKCATISPLKTKVRIPSTGEVYDTLQEAFPPEAPYDGTPYELVFVCTTCGSEYGMEWRYHPDLSYGAFSRYALERFAYWHGYNTEDKVLDDNALSEHLALTTKYEYDLLEDEWKKEHGDSVPSPYRFRKIDKWYRYGGNESNRLFVYGFMPDDLLLTLGELRPSIGSYLPVKPPYALTQHFVRYFDGTKLNASLNGDYMSSVCYEPNEDEDERTKERNKPLRRLASQAPWAYPNMVMFPYFESTETLDDDSNGYLGVKGAEGVDETSDKEEEADEEEEYSEGDLAQGEDLVDVCLEADNPCVAVREVEGPSMSLTIAFNRMSCAGMIQFPIALEKGVNDRYVVVVNGREIHSGSVLDGIDMPVYETEDGGVQESNKLIVDFPYERTTTQRDGVTIWAYRSTDEMRNLFGRMMSNLFGHVFDIGECEAFKLNNYDEDKVPDTIDMTYKTISFCIYGKLDTKLGKVEYRACNANCYSAFGLVPFMSNQSNMPFRGDLNTLLVSNMLPPPPNANEDTPVDTGDDGTDAALKYYYTRRKRTKRQYYCQESPIDNRIEESFNNFKKKESSSSQPDDGQGDGGDADPGIGPEPMLMMAPMPGLMRASVVQWVEVDAAAFVTVATDEFSAFSGSYAMQCMNGKIETYYGTLAAGAYGISYYLFRLTDANDKMYWVVCTSMDPDEIEAGTATIVARSVEVTPTEFPYDVEWELYNGGAVHVDMVIGDTIPVLVPVEESSSGSEEESSSSSASGGGDDEDEERVGIGEPMFTCYKDEVDANGYHFKYNEEDFLKTGHIYVRKYHIETCNPFPMPGFGPDSEPGYRDWIVIPIDPVNKPGRYYKKKVIHSRGMAPVWKFIDVELDDGTIVQEVGWFASDAPGEEPFSHERKSRKDDDEEGQAAVSDTDMPYVRKKTYQWRNKISPKTCVVFDYVDVLEAINKNKTDYDQGIPPLNHKCPISVHGGTYTDIVNRYGIYVMGPYDLTGEQKSISNDGIDYMKTFSSEVYDEETSSTSWVEYKDIVPNNWRERFVAGIFNVDPLDRREVEIAKMERMNGSDEFSFSKISNLARYEKAWGDMLLAPENDVELSQYTVEPFNPVFSMRYGIYEKHGYQPAHALKPYFQVDDTDDGGKKYIPLHTSLVHSITEDLFTDYRLRGAIDMERRIISDKTFMLVNNLYDKLPYLDYRLIGRNNREMRYYFSGYPRSEHPAYADRPEPPYPYDRQWRIGGVKTGRNDDTLQDDEIGRPGAGISLLTSIMRNGFMYLQDSWNSYNRIHWHANVSSNTVMVLYAQEVNPSNGSAIGDRFNVKTVGSKWDDEHLVWYRPYDDSQSAVIDTSTHIFEDGHYYAFIMEFRDPQWQLAGNPLSSYSDRVGSDSALMFTVDENAVSPATILDVSYNAWTHTLSIVFRVDDANGRLYDIVGFQYVANDREYEYGRDEDGHKIVVNEYLNETWVTPGNSNGVDYLSGKTQDLESNRFGDNVADESLIIRHTVSVDVRALGIESTDSMRVRLITGLSDDRKGLTLPVFNVKMWANELLKPVEENILLLNGTTTHWKWVDSEDGTGSWEYVDEAIPVHGSIQRTLDDIDAAKTAMIRWKSDHTHFRFAGMEALEAYARSDDSLWEEFQYGHCIGLYIEQHEGYADDYAEFVSEYDEEGEYKETRLHEYWLYDRGYDGDFSAWYRLHSLYLLKSWLDNSPNMEADFQSWASARMSDDAIVQMDRYAKSHIGDFEEAMDVHIVYPESSSSSESSQESSSEPFSSSGGQEGSSDAESSSVDEELVLVGDDGDYWMSYDSMFGWAFISTSRGIDNAIWVHEEINGESNHYNGRWNDLYGNEFNDRQDFTPVIRPLYENGAIAGYAVASRQGTNPYGDENDTVNASGDYYPDGVYTDRNGQSQVMYHRTSKNSSYAGASSSYSETVESPSEESSEQSSEISSGVASSSSSPYSREMNYDEMDVSSHEYVDMLLAFINGDADTYNSFLKYIAGNDGNFSTAFEELARVMRDSAGVETDGLCVFTDANPEYSQELNDAWTEWLATHGNDWGNDDDRYRAFIGMASQSMLPIGEETPDMSEALMDRPVIEDYGNQAARNMFMKTASPFGNTYSQYVQNLNSQLAEQRMELARLVASKTEIETDTRAGMIKQGFFCNGFENNNPYSSGNADEGPSVNRCFRWRVETRPYEGSYDDVVAEGQNGYQERFAAYLRMQMDFYSTFDSQDGLPLRDIIFLGDVKTDSNRILMGIDDSDNSARTKPDSNPSPDRTVSIPERTSARVDTTRETMEANEDNSTRLQHTVVFGLPKKWLPGQVDGDSCPDFMKMGWTDEDIDEESRTEEQKKLDFKGIYYWRVATYNLVDHPVFDAMTGLMAVTDGGGDGEYRKHVAVLANSYHSDEIYGGTVYESNGTPAILVAKSLLSRPLWKKNSESLAFRNINGITGYVMDGDETEAEEAAPPRQYDNGWVSKEMVCDDGIVQFVTDRPRKAVFTETDEGIEESSDEEQLVFADSYTVSIQDEMAPAIDYVFRLRENMYTDVNGVSYPIYYNEPWALWMYRSVIDSQEGWFIGLSVNSSETMEGEWDYISYDYGSPEQTVDWYVKNGVNLVAANVSVSLDGGETESSSSSSMDFSGATVEYIDDNIGNYNTRWIPYTPLRHKPFVIRTGSEYLLFSYKQRNVARLKRTDQYGNVSYDERPENVITMSRGFSSDIFGEECVCFPRYDCMALDDIVEGAVSFENHSLVKIDGTTWRMYFNVLFDDGDGVHYEIYKADTHDFSNWDSFAKVAVVSGEPAIEQYNVLEPFVCIANGGFEMYASSRSQGEQYRTIKLYTSNDGVSFVYDRTVTVSSDGQADFVSPFVFNIDENHRKLFLGVRTLPSQSIDTVANIIVSIESDGNGWRETPYSVNTSRLVIEKANSREGDQIPTTFSNDQYSCPCVIWDSDFGCPVQRIYYNSVDSPYLYFDGVLEKTNGLLEQSIRTDYLEEYEWETETFSSSEYDSHPIQYMNSDGEWEDPVIEEDPDDPSPVPVEWPRYYPSNTYIKYEWNSSGGCLAVKMPTMAMNSTLRSMVQAPWIGFDNAGSTSAILRPEDQYDLDYDISIYTATSYISENSLDSEYAVWDADVNQGRYSGEEASIRFLMDTRRYPKYAWWSRKGPGIYRYVGWNVMKGYNWNGALFDEQ